MIKEIRYEDFNLITNPSFETDTSGWTISGMTRSDSNNDTTVDINYDDVLGNYSIKVVGDSTTTKSITQIIDVTGSAGDSLVFGGWAKGYTQPGNYQSDKNYSIKLTIQEYEIELIQTLHCKGDVCYPITTEERTDYPREVYLNFNTDIDSWQYLMTEVVTTREYDEVEFKVEYQGEGTIYFDGLQLYQEEFGTSYTYVGQDDPTNQTKSGKIKTVDGPNTANDIVLSYDENDDLIQILSVDGTVTDIVNTDRKVDTVTRNNVKVDFDYDSDTGNGDWLTIGDESGNYFKTSTQYAYNKQFVDKTIDPYGLVIDYEYDPVTGLLELLELKDSDDTVITSTDYEYDVYGRLLTVTKDGAGNTYVYSKGKLKRIEVNGFYYEFNYDDFNRIEEVKVNQQTLMSYDYYTETKDSVVYNQNKIHNQYYGNGDKITFLYDEEDRISDIKFNDDIRFHYEYDYAGRLAIYQDIHNDDEFSYKYDLNGRLESITDLNNNTITFGYNENGQMSDYDYTIDGNTTNVDYNYYTDGVFKDLYSKTTFNVNGTSIEKVYNYDDDSLKRLNNIALSMDTFTINQAITYDDSSVVNGNASTRIKTISYDIDGLNYSYTYDNIGNITDIVVKENTQDVEVYHYEYDDLNQLVREDVNLKGEDNDFTKVYDYDKQGNIVARIERSDVSTETTEQLLLSDVGKITYEYTYAWKDQLSNFNENDIHYDNAGNPTEIGSDISLEWEGRQLTKYTDTSQNLVIEYKYNDQGYRTEKKVTINDQTITTNYFLDGDKVLRETRTDGVNIDYFYDIDGKLTGFSYNNNIYLYIRNIQGDITKIVDESGNVVVEYSYDAWSNIEYQTDNDLAKINPYRYRGYRYDEETSLYYLNSRYYNPDMGRFLNADGLVGQQGDILGHNMYAYAKNNPITLSIITKSNNITKPDNVTNTNAIYNGYSTNLINTNTTHSVVNINNKFELFTPIHVQAHFEPSNYGQGGARFLYFDLVGPTVDNNGFTIVDAGTGLIRFDDKYEVFGWGVSLFKANAFAGNSQDKKGIDCTASVFNAYGEFYIPTNDNVLKIGGEVNFLTVGFKAKYEDGKFVIGAGFGLIGGSIIIGFE